MSLKRNILANYLSQGYVSLIGVVMLPVYLRYMGAEAFGLVGFFVMLNALFMLLDMGMTPTLSRETARFRGGAVDGSTLRGLVRILELIFLSVAVIGALAFFVSSESIAEQWLKPERLSPDEVKRAIVLMGLIVPLRWMGGLYRGAINGFERQVWLAGFNTLIASGRFVGVLAVFLLVGTTPTIFFSYQLAVAAVELAGLALMTYRLLPVHTMRQPLRKSWSVLKNVLGFSLAIAFTGAVWILITQTDKLVLSRLLSLSDYGYFSLAVTVAAGVNLVGAPVAQAMLPRLARLVAEGNEAAVIALYRKGTQLVCALGVSAALVVGVFAVPVLWAWTGDNTAVAAAAPILAIYALGNGLLAMGSLSYALQYAKGDLRLHVQGNVLLMVLMIPGVVWAATRWGAIGAGWAWTAGIGLYFLLWMPLIHRRLAPKLHLPWLTKDVLPIVGAACATASVLAYTLPLPPTRLMAGAMAAGAGLLILVTAVCASSAVWAKFLQMLNERRSAFAASELR